MRLADAFRLADAAGRAVPLEALRAAAQPELQGVLLLPRDRGSPEKRARPARAAPAPRAVPRAVLRAAGRSALLVAAPVPCAWRARRGRASMQGALPLRVRALRDASAPWTGSPSTACDAALRQRPPVQVLLASGCACDAQSARQGARSG